MDADSFKLQRQPEWQEDEQDRNNGKGGRRRMNHNDDRGDWKRREVGKGILRRAWERVASPSQELGIVKVMGFWTSYASFDVLGR